MAEEDAFWCLVYIIESLMPPEYYSRDKQLIGAQVDQVCKSTVFEKPAKSLISILRAKDGISLESVIFFYQKKNDGHFRSVFTNVQ